MAEERSRSLHRAPLLGKAMKQWGEGWVLFVRSAGGRVEDVVGDNPWLAATKAARDASK